MVHPPMFRPISSLDLYRALFAGVQFRMIVVQCLAGGLVRVGWGMNQLTRATTGFERYNCASAPAIAVAGSTRRRSLLEAAEAIAGPKPRRQAALVAPPPSSSLASFDPALIIAPSLRS